MIRVEGERFPAGRSLLHLPLKPERYSTVACAFDVIAWNPTPALCRSLYRRSKRRARLSAEVRLCKRDVIVRTIAVKRLAAEFLLETDRSVRVLVRRGWVDHTPLILCCPGHQGVAIARQECAHIHQRSNLFRRILSSLCDGDTAHAVPGQNHRLGLRTGDFAYAVGVAFQRHGRCRGFVISVPWQIRREDLVALSFEQWNNLPPAPAAVPRAMNQQIG